MLLRGNQLIDQVDAPALRFDRYMAVVKGEKADILPRLPILMQFAAEHIGSNYGAFASDYRVLVEADGFAAPARTVRRRCIPGASRTEYVGFNDYPGPWGVCCVVREVTLSAR